MADGFWTHPDFTLAKAHYAFQWAGIEHYFKLPDELVLIEHVAAGDYKDCGLFAVWWWDIHERQDNTPDAPFALPAGYTQFRFRSYESVHDGYPVIIAGEPKAYESTLPLGTIVTVRC
jgi:hypothetical protein